MCHRVFVECLNSSVDKLIRTHQKVSALKILCIRTAGIINLNWRKSSILNNPIIINYNNKNFALRLRTLQIIFRRPNFPGESSLKTLPYLLTPSSITKKHRESLLRKLACLFTKVTSLAETFLFDVHHRTIFKARKNRMGSGSRQSRENETCSLRIKRDSCANGNVHRFFRLERRRDRDRERLPTESPLFWYTS